MENKLKALNEEEANLIAERDRLIAQFNELNEKHAQIFKEIERIERANGLDEETVTRNKIISENLTSDIEEYDSDTVRKKAAPIIGAISTAAGIALALVALFVPGAAIAECAAGAMLFGTVGLASDGASIFNAIKYRKKRKALQQIQEQKISEEDKLKLHNLKKELLNIKEQIDESSKKRGDVVIQLMKCQKMIEDLTIKTNKRQTTKKIAANKTTKPATKSSKKATSATATV